MARSQERPLGPGVEGFLQSAAKGLREERYPAIESLVDAWNRGKLGALITRQIPRPSGTSVTPPNESIGYLFPETKEHPKENVGILINGVVFVMRIEPPVKGKGFKVGQGSAPIDFNPVESRERSLVEVEQFFHSGNKLEESTIVILHKSDEPGKREELMDRLLRAHQSAVELKNTVREDLSDIHSRTADGVRELFSGYFPQEGLDPQRMSVVGRLRPDIRLGYGFYGSMFSLSLGQVQDPSQAMDMGEDGGQPK